MELAIAIVTLLGIALPIFAMRKARERKTSNALAKHSVDELHAAIDVSVRHDTTVPPQ
jgi:hypothetical protein